MGCKTFVIYAWWILMICPCSSISPSVFALVLANWPNSQLFPWLWVIASIMASVQPIKYLSMTTIRRGLSLSFNTGSMRIYFFSVCNCIYARAKHLDELVHLALQEGLLTYLPTYIQIGLMRQRQLNTLWDGRMNRMRIWILYNIKLFGFNKKNR